MKKIIMLLCVFTLFFYTVSPAMAANEAYDHNALLEYEGYGQAMYETVVEQTSFITGQYTNNKEFVSGTIDQIVDYAKFWKDEAADMWEQDTLRAAIEKGGGLLLTVGDWVKNIFNDYGEKYYPPEVDGGGYNEFVYVVDNCANYKPDCNKFRVNPKYEMIISDKRLKSSDGEIKFSTSGQFLKEPVPYAKKQMSIHKGSIGVIGTGFKEFTGNQAMVFSSSVSDFVNGDFAKVVYLLNMFGLSVSFVQVDTGSPVTPITKPNPYTDFKKHVNDNIGNITTPQPRPYLVCPGGTRIEMSISGGTFLSADGTAMLVNKDGSATVNSDICKLGWDKPVVKYIGDKAAVETPDGKWQDAETGELLDDDGGDDGSCSGVICLAGKIIDGIVGITKAITGLAKTILDGLIGIFVPKDLNFVSAEFDKIKNTFDEKLGIVGYLKVTMENFFAQENTNPLVGLEMSLPATGGKTIDVMETGLIEQHVPTLKKVMSGVLVLMTVFYLYRKITGRGGVMEK